MKTDASFYLERLKSTAFGRFFRNNLKNFYIFRIISSLIWNKIIPKILQFSSNLKITLAGEYFSLEKMSGIPAKSTLKLHAGSLTTIDAPLIIPDEMAKPTFPSERQQNILGFYIKVINNAQAIGCSNIFIADARMVAHDHYSFRTDYTSEELHGRLKVYPRLGRAKIAKTVALQTLSQAALFTDSCSSNYAHWITEVLPRINQFCSQRQFSHVPLLVDANLHVNIMASLQLVVGESRKIIPLAKGERINVAELYVTSPSGYIPFDRRTQEFSSIMNGVFSYACLRDLRSYMLSTLGFDGSLKDKLYIRRNSGYRLVDNHQVIESLLANQGYKVIEPEKLSFAEQVACFSQAKIIVGATGAAFANLIFAPPGSKMVILFPRIEDSAYAYWQNMAHSVGVDVAYLLGEISRKNGAHSNFVIDLHQLISLLSSMHAL